MRKSVMSLAVIAAAALALTGCASGGGSSSPAAGNGDKPFKVVAFTSGNQTPIGAWFVKATTAKAKELGWDLTMVQGDFDFQKMNPQVESAIDQGADAVLDGYTGYDSISSILNEAKSANVPVFGIDSVVDPNSDFALDVTPNQQQMVDQSLDVLKQKLGGSLSGKNIMIIGHDPEISIRKRQGLAQAALAAAGAKLAGGAIQKVLDPSTGRQESLKFVADYLSAHPNGLDAVWTGWDDSAMGALQAVQEAGSKAYVASGSDAISEALAAIEKGDTFVATIDAGHPGMLDKVVDAMQTYRKTGKLPSKNFVQTDVTLVTKDNAASITPSDKLG